MRLFVILRTIEKNGQLTLRLLYFVVNRHQGSKGEHRSQGFAQRN